MRIEYDRTRIRGYRYDEKGRLTPKAEDDFIHLRQQDPILMAARRSQEMAGCDSFEVDTRPAFSRWIDDVVVSFMPSRAEAMPDYEW